MNNAKIGENAGSARVGDPPAPGLATGSSDASPFGMLRRDSLWSSLTRCDQGSVIINGGAPEMVTMRRRGISAIIADVTDRYQARSGRSVDRPPGSPPSPCEIISSAMTRVRSSSGIARCPRVVYQSSSPLSSIPTKAPWMSSMRGASLLSVWPLRIICNGTWPDPWGGPVTCVMGPDQVCR